MGDYDVSHLIWVMGFSNETSLDELGHLFLYDFQTFKIELSSFLVDWRVIMVSEQFINDNLRIYYWNVA